MKASSFDLSATEWIDLLIAKADELRRAGVIELSQDRVVFAPYEDFSRVPMVEIESEEEPAVDPWSDAVGMGFEPGTEIPNFGRKVDDGE